MTVISGVGSENTNPAATTLIEGETAGGVGERFQIANLHKNMTQGTTSQAGVNELATNAETVTGTSTSLVTTPAGVAAAIAASSAGIIQMQVFS